MIRFLYIYLYIVYTYRMFSLLIHLNICCRQEIVVIVVEVVVVVVVVVSKKTAALDRLLESWLGLGQWSQSQYV